MIKLEDVKPLHNLVAVREVAQPGAIIHTPGNASNEQRVFAVLGSGPGRIENSIVASAGLKRGDLVLIGSCSWLTVRTDKGMIQIVSDDQIWCVVGHVDVDAIQEEPRLELS